MSSETAGHADLPVWRQDKGIVLRGAQCRACGQKSFPGKEVCPNCGSDQMTPVDLARRGKLYSFTTIHIAPTGLTTPYTVGYVDLEDGVRVFAQIEGEPGSHALDEAVEPTVGIIRTGEDGPVEGYKFRRVA